jgi:hypothetical protein
MTGRTLALTLCFATTASCGGVEGPCAGERDEIARENCQLERVSAQFEAGDARWKETLRAIDSAASRDLVRLRLAVLSPQQGPALCAEVETEPAQERCKRVVGRPHLASPPRPSAEAQP